MKLHGRFLGLISATVIATCIALAVFALPTKHSVIILNRTDEDIRVLHVRIDNRSFDTGGVLLAPTKPEERLNNLDKRLDYKYKSTGESRLTIIATNGANTQSQMSCKLIDHYGAGCVYYAAIRAGATLTCVCDSNADFYD
jgi:hypothetical protein